MLRQEGAPAGRKPGHERRRSPFDRGPRAGAAAQQRAAPRGRSRPLRDCRRTPLVGERMFVYASGRAVCELCRTLRPDEPAEVASWSCATRARPHGAERVSRAAGRLRAPWIPSPSPSPIGRPREEVFDYLADIANHAEFTDHFLKDWHLTREDSSGAGAGARFRVDAPLDRFPWADMTSSRSSAPRRHRRGRPRRQVQPDPTLGTYWTLEPAGRGTHAGRVHDRDRARAAHRPAARGARRRAAG